MGGFTKKSKKIIKKSKPCFFHMQKINYIDYKEVETISRFINKQGAILGSSVTGVCSKHQRPLAVAIKRARLVALIPFTKDKIRQ